MPFTINEVFAVTVVDEQEVVKFWKLNVVPEFTIAPPPLIVMVPEDGFNVPVELLVKVPFTVKFVFAVTVAPEATVIFWKLKVVPEFTILEPLLKVMVPELGDKVQVLPLVRVPTTVKDVFAVTVVEEHAVVKPLNVRVPALVITPPPFIVIVPALGVNVPVTLKVPATVASAVAPVIEPLIVNPPDPELPYV